jgi:hypothetical protein
VYYGAIRNYFTTDLVRKHSIVNLDHVALWYFIHCLSEVLVHLSQHISWLLARLDPIPLSKSTLWRTPLLYHTASEHVTRVLDNSEHWKWQLKPTAAVMATSQDAAVELGSVPLVYYNFQFESLFSCVFPPFIGTSLPVLTFSMM